MLLFKKTPLIRGFIWFGCLLLLTLVAPVSQAQETETPDTSEPLELEDPLRTVRMSDSPYLRVPAEVLALPLAEPYAGPPGPTPIDPMASITYDLATQQTTVTPSNAPSAQAIQAAIRKVEQFGGLAPIMATTDGLDLHSPIGDDDRTRITNTGSFPWRSITRLAVTWSDGGGSACSGAIIDSYHILTAGHCVFDYGGTDAWASSVQVFPGLNDDYAPYNHAWVTRFHSFTGWTDSGMTEHDWAVVAIDRSVGDFTGWMGRQTADSDDAVYTGILNVAGYPATPPNSEVCPSWANCMYFDSDSGHSADIDNHWYSMDTSGGMSGGPVWRYNSGNNTRYILTTHTCGTGGCGISSNSVNHGTRLNQDKYDRIISWIAGDADIVPNDRADLIDDGENFSGFNPQTVSDGSAFGAYSDVRNIGTANSGGFYVSYYASTNTTITTGDYLLGNVYVSGGAAPFNYANANLSLSSFPSGIPDGTYYVGWLIDRFATVSEFSESNNVGYKAGYQLTVCGTPATPTVVAPLGGTRLADNTPMFDWGDVSGATYRLQIDDNSDFSSPLFNVALTSSTYTPSLVDGTYYWRVRAEKNCGVDSGWSATRLLSIVDTGPVYYLNRVIDDDKLGESYGDNDGVPDCGETIELDVTLRNLGSDYASNTNMELSSTSGYVSFPYNTSSSYGTISGGNGTAVNNNDYDITLSANIPHNTNIPFRTTATANEGGPWYYNFYLFVQCLPPAQPLNFDASNTSFNVEMDWTAVSDAESYEIWWSPYPYATPSADCAVAPNCTSTTGTSHTHYNVVGNGNFYNYTLYAVSLGGQKSAAPHHVGKFEFDIVPGN